MYQHAEPSSPPTSEPRDDNGGSGRLYPRGDAADNPLVLLLTLALRGLVPSTADLSLSSLFFFLSFYLSRPLPASPSRSLPPAFIVYLLDLQLHGP